VKRSFGFTFGYTLLALKGIQDGIKRIHFDKDFAKNELINHREAYLSMIQTKDRLTDPLSYEKLKSKYRGKTLNNDLKIDEINLDVIVEPAKTLVESVIKQFQEL